jgi:hypothetical protein
MKNKKLSELTLEELEAKKKHLKGAAIGLGSVMAIASILLIYLGMKTKNYALIAVAIGCSVAFLPMFASLGQINSEIKSREDK